MLGIVRYKEFYTESGETLQEGIALYDFDTADLITTLSEEEYDIEYNEMFKDSDVIETVEIGQYTTVEEENDDGDYTDVSVDLEVKVFPLNLVKRHLRNVDCYLVRQISNNAPNSIPKFRQYVEFCINAGLPLTFPIPYYRTEEHAALLEAVRQEYNLKWRE